MNITYLHEMRKVLHDQKWAKTALDSELYYIYRGIKPRRTPPFLRKERGLRGKKKNGLRYDITVIPPKMLGKEFVKTKGHEHSKNYGELYIVLKGQALYLIQKYKNNRIEDVYAVRAEKGESVVVPPHYGHLTINPLKKELIEANWVNEKCKNIYDLFEKKQGACYYYTKSGWLKNKNYKKVPKLRFEKPLKKIPVDLSFLKGRTNKFNKYSKNLCN